MDHPSVANRLVQLLQSGAPDTRWQSLAYRMSVRDEPGFTRCHLETKSQTAVNRIGCSGGNKGHYWVIGRDVSGDPEHNLICSQNRRLLRPASGDSVIHT